MVGIIRDFHHSTDSYRMANGLTRTCSDEDVRASPDSRENKLRRQHRHQIKLGKVSKGDSIACSPLVSPPFTPHLNLLGRLITFAAQLENGQRMQT